MTMPKARFKFNNDGSVEIIKGQHTIVLSKRETEQFSNSSNVLPLSMSQIGLAEDVKSSTETIEKGKTYNGRLVKKFMSGWVTYQEDNCEVECMLEVFTDRHGKIPDNVVLK
jgi:hypothetical protein